MDIPKSIKKHVLAKMSKLMGRLEGEKLRSGALEAKAKKLAAEGPEKAGVKSFASETNKAPARNPKDFPEEKMEEEVEKGAPEIEEDEEWERIINDCK